MPRVHRAVLALRLFLAVLFVALIPFEFLSLPGQFAHLAEESPDQAYLRWPSTAVTVFWVLCIQVVILAMWQLLTRVREDRIFSDASMGWVDLIVATIAVGWLTMVGALGYLGFTADDPGVLVLWFLLTAGVAVVGLLMVVMRALLRQATALRTDLEAVI